MFKMNKRGAGLGVVFTIAIGLAIVFLTLYFVGGGFKKANTHINDCESDIVQGKCYAVACADQTPSLFKASGTCYDKNGVEMKPAEPGKTLADGVKPYCCKKPET